MGTHYPFSGSGNVSGIVGHSIALLALRRVSDPNITQELEPEAALPCQRVIIGYLAEGHPNMLL